MSMPTMVHLEEGLSEPDIEAILGGNLMRVWRAAEVFSGDAG